MGVIVFVAGCGSSGGSAASRATQAPTPGVSAGSAGAGGTAAAARLGTTGSISQVNPTSIYVQNTQTQNQVTVNYSATTRFSQTVATTAGAVKVGDCVTATPAATSSTPSSGSAAASVTASEVTITSTTGTCTPGTGAGGAGRTPRGFPSGRVRPSGAPRGNGAFGRAAFGKVASVGDGTFVVTSTRTGKAATITVATTSATTYRQSVAATKASLKVGLCATAIGATDDTGAVTARTIAVSTPTSGGCSAFGGLGGGFRAGAAGGAG